MSILITGGAGFIGGYLVRHLLETGSESLVVLDLPSAKSNRYSRHGSVTQVAGSILDLSTLTSIIRDHQVHAVVHLACALSVTPFGYRGMVETNCVGTVNVFEAAKLSDVQKVVYLSSVFVYPLRRDLNGPALDETCPASPETIYGACKLNNELVASQYARDYNLELVGLRMASVFGPGRSERQGLEPDHFAAPELALSKRHVVMPPDNQICDWLYAPDAASACALALRTKLGGHRIYNVSAERKPMREATAWLRQMLPEADIGVDDRPHTLGSLVDTECIKTELGYAPKYSLTEGLRDYLRQLELESLNHDSERTGHRVVK